MSGGFGVKNDQEQVIIGHVRTIPEVGKSMEVLLTILTHIDFWGMDVKVDYRVHTSPMVAEVEPVDGWRVVKAKTTNGHIYIVEVWD